MKIKLTIKDALIVFKNKGLESLIVLLNSDEIECLKENSWLYKIRKLLNENKKISATLEIDLLIKKLNINENKK